jgi:hypothetical protein
VNDFLLNFLVQIVDPLALSQPPIRTESLLITPGTDLALKSNKEMVTYAVASSDIVGLVTVTKAGVLKTGKHYGKALLFVHSQSNGFNESLAILVEVSLSLRLNLSFSSRKGRDLTLWSEFFDPKFKLEGVLSKKFQIF